jgi:hypothetical protein
VLLERLSRETGKTYYPDKNGLLVVAATTSEIDFALDTKRLGRASNIVVVSLGLGECEETGMSFAEFICKLYCNELTWGKDLQKVIWTVADDPFFASV